ncbi:MAG: antitoxin MazE family protein [Proteobacteria bacterium]|nr:antitoxin MazE family protein [Pseudomonadota bacterium]
MSRKQASRASVGRYRERMKRAGLRLVQLWVPDTRARGFAGECRRQSRIAAQAHQAEHEVLDWIEAQQPAEDWTA